MTHAVTYWCLSLISQFSSCAHYLLLLIHVKCQ
jgi:hypothetical protein